MQLSVYKKFNGRPVRRKTQGYIDKKKSWGGGADKKGWNQRLGES